MTRRLRIAVAGAATSLKERQDINKERDLKSAILEALQLGGDLEGGADRDADPGVPAEVVAGTGNLDLAALRAILDKIGGAP